MNIATIKKEWSRNELNKQAAIDLWDSMAKQYQAFQIPTVDKDPFLQLLMRLGCLNKEAKVLDVGCGSGRYTLALADHCKEITGIDLSSKMLKIAENKMTEMNKTNVCFIQSDWHTFDLTPYDMIGKYDLVFAHMTPAIQNSETFYKMIQASKDLCIMVKPSRRTDPVSDAVKRLAGITERRESSEKTIIYAFALLLLDGYMPMLEYRKEQWDMKKTIEEAYALYINRVKSYKDISLSEEEGLKDYIRSLSINGTVSELVDTTITTLYWRV